MMHRGAQSADTFKSMALNSNILKPSLSLEITETMQRIGRGVKGQRVKVRLSFSSAQDAITSTDSGTRDTATHRAMVSPTTAEHKNLSGEQLTLTQCKLNCTEENGTAPLPTGTAADDCSPGKSKGALPDSPHNHYNRGENDADVAQRAQEEGVVNVVFPGFVSQEGCCRFVSEIIKCILYQRQQLPMPYDELMSLQVKDKETVGCRPEKLTDLAWRKSQRTLQELEEVLQQLGVLFSLSFVPRVLLLLGGSIVLPKEFYEINMEALLLADADQCLQVSTCLRQLFRQLFVADILSAVRPVRLMPTTVLALAHRDCGVGWFQPKLQFKEPACVKKCTMTLSSDPHVLVEPKGKVPDWQDYIWFQAPMNIKGLGS